MLRTDCFPEEPDLPRTYLARHELESVMIIIIIINGFMYRFAHNQLLGGEMSLSLCFVFQKREKVSRDSHLCRCLIGIHVTCMDRKPRHLALLPE